VNTVHMCSLEQEQYHKALHFSDRWESKDKPKHRPEVPLICGEAGFSLVDQNNPPRSQEGTLSL
jgi:hypothetical protein